MDVVSLESVRESRANKPAVQSVLEGLSLQVPTQLAGEHVTLPTRSAILQQECTHELLDLTLCF